MNLVKPVSRICLFLAIVALLLLSTFIKNPNDIVTYLRIKIAKCDLNISDGSNISKSAKEKQTLFLAWSKWYPNMNIFNLSILFDTCPELNCTLTFDRKLVNESAAVFFYVYNIEWNDLPQFRRCDQYYIFHIMESPENTDYYGPDLKSPDRRTFFNLTSTYRLDSSVPWTYGTFKKITGPRSNNDSLSNDELMDIVKNKSKLIAWFVSNCDAPSGRQFFVKELKRYTQVDIYSKSGCGPLKCPRGNKLPYPGLSGASPCQQMLSKDYKFYLALENSICKDYVTEKLYDIMDKSIVIPIVFDRKILLDTVMDEEIAKILNQSFIAVDDFPNVQTFYEYLKYLDGNITAYMEYFKWRENIRAINYDWITLNFGCDLCRLVKQKKEHRIKDIYKWWHEEAYCRRYKPQS